VVQVVPLATDGAGGRDGLAGGQPYLRGRLVRPVLHEHPPAIARPGRGDVAAEAHQDADVKGGGHQPGAAVGGVGLGGRPEVELQSPRNGQLLAVQADAPPVGPGEDGDPIRGDTGEVPVVAESTEDSADCRVDVAVGPRGRRQRDRHQLGQQRAHRLPATVPLDPAELAVRPEPAARLVDRGQLAVHNGSGRRHGGRLGQDDPGGRAPDRPLVGVLVDRERLLQWHGYDPPDVAWEDPLSVVTLVLLLVLVLLVVSPVAVVVVSEAWTA
jgi:hypothetical protein